jgi:SAM-dependent methyltransferase
MAPTAADQTRLASVWDERTQKYGARCVINLGHPAENFDRITVQQKAILFPVLRRLLTGREQSALDFGCGSGRFTPALRELLSSGQKHVSVVGYDVSEELLRLAPAAEGLSFTSDYSKFYDGSSVRCFDLIWVCLVLGGIPDELCREIAGSLSNSLREDGLLFLVEHISNRRAGNEFWKFRPQSDYQAMFGDTKLYRVGHYSDFGSKISILAGTKSAKRARSLRLLSVTTSVRNVFRRSAKLGR